MKYWVSAIAVISLAAFVFTDTDSDDEEANFLKKNAKKLSKDWKKQEESKPKDVPTNDEKPLFEQFKMYDDQRATQTRESLERKERSVSPEGSTLKINLVSFHGSHASRVRRAAYNTTENTWPRRIPYTFDPSFPQDERVKVQRVMEEIMGHVCVEWVYVPDFDPENNEFETNAYLKIFASTNSICSALLGQGGSAFGPRALTLCSSYETIVHELFHCLGVIHEQQSPKSLRHVTRVKENVASGFFGSNYQPKNYPEILNEVEFDASSVMMYSPWQFSKNGRNIILPIRKDEISLNGGHRTNTANTYAELNQVYRCRETYCNDQDVDCGLGYFTRIKGECKCVCPDGFDVKTNCQDLESETSGVTEWPDAPFSVYAVEANVCPDGFTSARIDITGTWDARWQFEKFFFTQGTVHYYMCTKNSDKTDMSAMPMGTYCVVKPKNVECTKPFSEGGFIAPSAQEVTTEGNFGDWEISNMTVTMKFCCRTDLDTYHDNIQVPRNTPFRLISKNGKCPPIKGMRSTVGRITMFVQNGKKYGSNPGGFAQSYYVMHTFCTYRPAVYGCNKVITLDKDNRDVIIKTPGFDAGERESNRRCLYYFKIPKGSRAKVSVVAFDIHSTDQFKVRRFNKYSLAQTDFNTHIKKEFFTDKDFLFLEYWSGMETGTGKKGIHLTAKVLLEEESCYPTADKGRSYKGTKSITEDFEQCVPWREAAQSPDFPYSSHESLELLTHNYCRNPMANMEGPWCYVLADKGMYRKAYCDVCNKLENIDRDDGCAEMKAADPNFCDSALQRLKCSKTCGMNIDHPVPPQHCGQPTIPEDGMMMAWPEPYYYVGQSIPVACTTRSHSAPPIQITCTTDGWPNLDSACSECPSDWVPHHDRCYFFDPYLLGADQSSYHCQNLGGRLFILRNSYDVSGIRQFKHNPEIFQASGSSWINAKLTQKDGQWSLLDDPNTPVPYLDWAEGAETNDPLQHGYAVMIYEGADKGFAGKFTTTSSNALSRTFCEMPRKVPRHCSDVSRRCATAMDNDAEFCLRESSAAMVGVYCMLSCGVCYNGVADYCYDPEGINYHRLTTNDNVRVGRIMEFACNDGYHLVSGQLRRACGIGGNFRGQEPVCSDKTSTVPVDIGAEIVQDRHFAVNTRLAYVVDVDGYRVPFAGNITHWHFHGSYAGNFQAMVYRFLPDSDMFTFIGSNKLTISVINQRWSVAVPTGDQIMVKEGDVYGLFTTQGLIDYTNCGSTDEKPMMVRTFRVRSLSALTSKNRMFGTKQCGIPSLGMRVHP